MGNDIKDKFTDTIDTINKIAKLHNWLNGLEWAKFAVQFSLITEKQFIEYEKLHILRNTMSHGNSKNIIVSSESYSFAKIFLSICEKKIRDNKFPNGKVQSNKKKIQKEKVNNASQSAPQNQPKRRIFIISNINGTYFEKYVSDYFLDENFTDSLQNAMQFHNHSEAIACLNILRGKSDKGEWWKLVDDLFIKEVAISK